jgi:NADH-quinone oxidoreductase subunit C
VSAAPCHDVALADWGTALRAAREDGFDFFDWLSAVDQTDDAEAPGFDVVCHLIDSASGAGSLRRLLVRTRVPDGEPVRSITDLWAGAAWHERETHEMFGIDFEGFEDGSGLGMRPLLLPDGFEGTPLRKSFVLVSRVSKAWPGAKEPGEGGESPEGTQRPERPGRPGRTGAPSRRKVAPPGVPDPSWGPR